MEHAQAPVTHLLVAVDGSEHALRAAGWAGRLASALGARVTLLHVVPLPGSMYELGLTEGPIPDDLPAARAVRRHAEAVLSGAEAALGLPAGQVVRQSEIGVPARSIARQAERLGADLIVVGHRGLGSLGELLMGSTSHQVLHLARCPVAVI